MEARMAKPEKSRFAVSIVAQSRIPGASKGGVRIKHALAIVVRPANETDADAKMEAIGQYEQKHSDWEVIGCLCEEIHHG
jgi:hypothetical protein